jgi:hypothetical protein
MNMKARLLAAASVALVFLYTFIVAVPQSASAGQSDGSSQHQSVSQQPEAPLIEATQERLYPIIEPPPYLVRLDSKFSPELLAICHCTFPLGTSPAKGCKPVPIALKVRIKLTEVDPTVKLSLANAGFDPVSGVGKKQQIGRISPPNLLNLLNVTNKSGKRILKFVWLADDQAISGNKNKKGTPFGIPHFIYESDV